MRRRAANLALRAGALGGRFALSVALVRWLPMSDVGLFGLLAGIAGAAPTLMGLGVNYFFARDAAHARGGEAASLMRDRLALTGIAIAGAALAMSALAATGIVEWPPHAALFCAIVAFEVVALDMHMGLVGMDRSTTAGALLFVRSAAWIPAWAMLACNCFRSVISTTDATKYCGLPAPSLTAATLTSHHTAEPLRDM